MAEYRVILSGSSPAAGEVWSSGCSLTSTAPPMDQTEISAWALGIANAIEALGANSLLTLLSTAGAITTVRCELRGADTEALLLAGEVDLTPAKAGAGTANKVLQASVVISFRTATPGRSYRGRAYWPAWGYTPTAELLFGSSNITSWLNDYADLLQLFGAQAIIVDPAQEMSVVVRSRLLHVSTPVTALAIGNVPDTQRRRRDAVNEAYTVLPQ